MIGICSRMTNADITVEAPQKLERHTPTVVEMIIPEEWRPVVGYEGLYEVSNYGRVKSLARNVPHGWTELQLVKERILQSRFDHRRYSQVLLCKFAAGQTRHVHLLVLESFVGPCPDGMECRHLNGDGFDNRLINLAWGTHQENVNDQRWHGTWTRGDRHASTKLTRWNILIDIPIFSVMGLSQCEIGRRLGVSSTSIRQVVIGHTWVHLYQESPPVFTSEIEQEYVAIRGTVVIDEEGECHERTD
jgi:hypothetical protein